MGSLARTPYHPLTVQALFEIVEPPVSEFSSGLHYGNINSPSVVSCEGINGNNPRDFEIYLTAYTSMSTAPAHGYIYHLSGKVIAPNVTEVPVINYNTDSIVKVVEAGSLLGELSNKTTVVGLGIVIDKKENINQGSKLDAASLLVTVKHNEWDQRIKGHRTFNVKYHVPASKNLVKTHGLFQLGREVTCVGFIVDWDVENNMMMVEVTSVSVTSGHQRVKQIGNSFSFTDNINVGRTGRQIVKFNSNPLIKNERDPSSSNAKETGTEALDSYSEPDGTQVLTSTISADDPREESEMSIEPDNGFKISYQKKRGSNQGVLIDPSKRLKN